MGGGESELNLCAIDLLQTEWAPAILGQPVITGSAVFLGASAFGAAAESHRARDRRGRRREHGPDRGHCYDARRANSGSAFGQEWATFWVRPRHRLRRAEGERRCCGDHEGRRRHRLSVAEAAFESDGQSLHTCVVRSFAERHDKRIQGMPAHGHRRLPAVAFRALQPYGGTSAESDHSRLLLDRTSRYLA